jgi:hypothetical protein
MSGGITLAVVVVVAVAGAVVVVSALGFEEPPQALSARARTQARGRAALEAGKAPEGTWPDRRLQLAFGEDPGATLSIPYA